MKEAIILAGGKGTRLASLTNNGQKVIVDIAGKPFITYILDKLIDEKFDRIILAAGFRSNEVGSTLKKFGYENLVSLMIEDEPLGTGGAISNSIKNITSEKFLVINGDTFNDVNFSSILTQHNASLTDASIVTKMIDNVSRYGTISSNQRNRIVKFQEKTGKKCPGIINSGIYALSKEFVENFSKLKFSFEDFIEKNVDKYVLKTITSNGYFIDIGIPNDFYAFKDKMEKKLDNI
jgi:D-glycero-alpha-D-manno-heptose 1-phosphate guanylyltransferase